MRSYRVVKRPLVAGGGRWAVEGSCLRCDWPACPDWVLMPWRWETADAAAAWVEAVQKRQAILATMSSTHRRHRRHAPAQ